MRIVWKKVDRENGAAITRFVMAHEPDMVPVAEELRAIEGDEGRRAVLLVAAFLGSRVIAVMYINDTQTLFPYWSMRYSAVICDALRADKSIAHALGAVYAISGRAEVVADISTCMMQQSERASRSERVRYLLMELRKRAAGDIPDKQKRDADTRITQATERDLPHIFPLHVAYLKEEVQLDRSAAMNYRYTLEHLRDSMSRHTYYIAWRDSHVIAKANSNAEGYRCAQLGGIFTQRRYRNVGIGYHCTVELCNALFSRYQSLVLFVKTQNHSAISLYTNIGFRPRCDYEIRYLS